MLHAAMHSGMNTYIVSNDQMRDARFLLGDKLSERFKQWQKRRQIKLPDFWHSGNTGLTETQINVTVSFIAFQQPNVVLSACLC